MQGPATDKGFHASLGAGWGERGRGGEGDTDPMARYRHELPTNKAQLGQEG